MARGIVRWAEKVGETEAWFAQVELAADRMITIPKSDYDVAGYNPPFWQLQKKRLASYSSVVSDGMKRLCNDFTKEVAALGFAKTGRRLWTRLSEWSIESIYFHRNGSTYGAPINASVSVRVVIGVRVLNDPGPGGGVGFFEDAPPRRADGSSYPNRFNAET